MRRLNSDQINNIYKEVLFKNNNRVVLIDTMTDRSIVGDECNRNIYFLNENNQIIWQVQVEPTGFDEDPFVSIGIGSDGKLHAINFSGFNYIINTETGIATRTGWNK